MESIKKQFTEAQEVLNTFMANPQNFEKIEEAAQILVHSFKNKGKVLSCGNGGSISDAAHFAEELSGRFREDRAALPAIALSEAGHITCVGNDYGFDFIFSRGVEALGQKGDVLLAISTSGNSKNVIEACKAAQKRFMKVIALTGKDGGALSQLADVEIRVAHMGYADRIQEVHIKIIHSLILRIEELLFA